MKKILFFAALAAFVACAKLAPEQTETPGNSDMPEQVEPQEVTIYATAPDTKTQLVDGGNVKWSAGDEISICFPITNGYLSGYSKYSSYPLSFVSQNTELLENALFKGNWTSQSYFNAYGVAIYPSTVNFSSYSEYKSYRQTTTTFDYTIPDVQYVEDNSFAKDVNLAYAPLSKSDMDANNASVTFKNLCALIRIVLPGENYNIKEIHVESETYNADIGVKSGVLHGNATLSFDYSSGEMRIGTWPTNTPLITLKKSDGSNLTPGAAYYAVVWPEKSHAGIKLTFIDANGNEAVKQTPSGKNYTFNAGEYHTFNISSLSFDEAPYLNIVGATSLSVPARGATNSFMVVANNPVSVSSPSNGWLSVTYDGSQVTAVAAANEGVTERTATITITSAGETKTVTVTQPPVYYTIGSVVLGARALEDQAMYVVFFGGSTQGSGNKEQTYCWTTDLEGDMAMASLTDKSQKVTANYVFKFHKTQSFTNNWMTDGQSYSNASSGYLQSMYNGKYQSANVASSMLDFIADDKASATELIFAGWWQGESGADLDIWDYATRSSGKKTMYWTGSYLNFSTDTNVYPRKWFFYKVTEVE